MSVVRSILWIGPGEHFAAGLVESRPTLDVVWECDLGDTPSRTLARFDAVVLDAPGAEGALVDIERMRPEGAPPVVVRISAKEAARSQELLAAGAAEVALRSRDDEARFLDRLERLARGDGTANTDAGGKPTREIETPAGLVGDAPAMRDLYTLLACAHRTRATVLISGETGTGKELVARAVHAGGARRRGAFIPLNCAAFQDTLLESELFGHARGAFTGADREKRGLFELANGGTLFLDEISETSRPFQAKLLRALQEREVRPVGGTTVRKVDVRLIAASNRSLWREAQEGRFREDLYYRLAVFPIHVPPLRERPGDVLALTEHFLALHGEREGIAGLRLAAETGELLRCYDWPGNVRELENEVQRALALSRPGELLTPSHFSQRVNGAGAESFDSAAGPAASLREELARVEAALIRRTLAAQGGRRTTTARRLGITREGLYKKMKRFGIT